MWEPEKKKQGDTYERCHALFREPDISDRNEIYFIRKPIEISTKVTKFRSEIPFR